MPDAAEHVDEFEVFRELIEIEGGIPVVGVRAVIFLDPEAEQHVRIKADGNPPLSTTIGLLELAKDFFLRMSWQSDEEED